MAPKRKATDKENSTRKRPRYKPVPWNERTVVVATDHKEYSLAALDLWTIHTRFRIESGDLKKPEFERASFTKLDSWIKSTIPGHGSLIYTRPANQVQTVDSDATLQVALEYFDKKRSPIKFQWKHATTSPSIDEAPSRESLGSQARKKISARSKAVSDSAASSETSEEAGALLGAVWVALRDHGLGVPGDVKVPGDGELPEMSGGLNTQPVAGDSTVAGSYNDRNNADIDHHSYPSSRLRVPGFLDVEDNARQDSLVKLPGAPAKMTAVPLRRSSRRLLARSA